MLTALGSSDFFEGSDFEIKPLSVEGNFREIDVGESRQISHYVKGQSVIESQWNGRKSEVLPNTLECGRKAALISSFLQGKTKPCDLNPDRAGKRDSIGNNDNRKYDPDKGVREYVLDKVQRGFNGDAGDVITEIYEEIIEPPIVIVLQAVGDQVIQNKTPP